MIPKLNSSHGSETRNIINRAIEVLNQQGRTIQDLVAEGQLTPDQYAELIRTVNDLIQKGEVSLNDLSAEVLEAIDNGSGAPFEILSIPRDKSVTPSKTTFVERGKNKFDGIYLDAILLGGATRIIEYSETGRTALIEVEQNTTYTISKSKDTDRFRVAAFKDYPKEDSTSTNADDNDSGDTLTLTTSDENYLCVYVSTDGAVPSELQVEKGEVKTPYTPPSVKFKEIEESSIPLNALDLNELSISPEQTTFIERTKNLFDGEYIKDYILAGAADGLKFIPEPSGVSVVFKAEKGKTYSISKSNDSNRFRVATNVNYPISGQEMTRSVYIEDVLTSVTVSLTGDEDHIVIYLSADGEIPSKLQIEEGSSVTDYEFPYSLSPSLFGEKGSVPSRNPVDFDFVITDDPGGVYSSTAPYIYHKVYANDIYVLYDMYDDLMDKYPDYITKTLLGNESTGLPIYRYDFKPPVNLQTSISDIEHPKIIYISSTHGMERQAFTDGICFFTDIADNWKTNDVLSMLRWNVHFIVIPILNPYGFSVGERKNGNGVDLNRNMPYKWEFLNDTESPNYTGPEPLSELESQYLDAVIRENTDALFAIDHHNFGPYPDFKLYASWVASSNNYKIERLSKGLSNTISGKIKKDYPYVPQDNSSVLSAKDSERTGYGGTVAQGIQALGVPSVILETAEAIGDVPEDNQTFSTDVLGNLILSVLRNAHLLNFYK